MKKGWLYGLVFSGLWIALKMLAFWLNPNIRLAQYGFLDQRNRVVHVPQKKNQHRRE
jgi:hypothetical protein